MLSLLRIAASAILLVVAMARGEFALAQFADDVPDNPPAQFAAIDAPAVAEKPVQPCQGVWAVPESAVTEGSFTVWTEPATPKAGEKYTIMVQIIGLKNLERFPRCDLVGSVAGTDGYKDYFGGPTDEGFIPIKDQTVRLPLLVVPGAAELVKDVIQINSKLLNEEQQIQIKFVPKM